MAQANKKRYWAVALLAAGIAESAHAPLRGNSADANVSSTAGAKVASLKSSAGIPDKQLPSSLQIPPLSDVHAPQDVRNPPLELAKIDPFPLLGLPPLSVSDPLPAVESGTQSISLLNPGEGGLPAQPQLSDSAPLPSSENPAIPSEPVAAPVVSVPTNPPVYGNPVVGAPTVSVPEPGFVSFLLGGVLLLGRRRADVRK